MNEIFVLYSLIYTVIAFCFVYKTDLFISIGLTVENIFDSYLGSEHDNFVIYHIKRTCITTILHLSIPFGFFTGLSIFKAQKHFVSVLGEVSWQVILFGSLALPVYALFVLIFQYQQDWHTHPIVKKLKKFENEQFTSWKAVCNEINSEFKQLEVILYCGNRMRLVLTRNWIINVGTYSLDFARQNDARLVVYSSDTHDTGSNRYSGVIQFINVKVIYLNETQEFLFRLHAFDFKDLKDGLRCPITVSQDVSFYQTKVDKFLEVFKEFIASNPPYESQNEEREMCFGCMTSEANVKLIKNCLDNEHSNEEPNGVPLPKCVSCECKPLWCVDCMGKWFALRQNQSATETWLSSKCPCPACRRTFCILDVSPVTVKS